MLFRNSAMRQPSFTLHLDGGSNPLVLLHCNTSRHPRTKVYPDHDFYVGNFGLTMDCMVQYPSDQFRLETILEPYLDVRLSFVTTSDERNLEQVERVNYDVQVNRVCSMV